MSQGDIMVIFSSNIGNVLWVCLALSLAIPYLKERHRKRSAAREALRRGEEAEMGGTTE